MTEKQLLMLILFCITFMGLMSPREVIVERIVEVHVETPRAVMMTQPANSNDPALINTCGLTT